MASHHRNKTYLLPLPIPMWLNFDGSGGAECPACGGIHIKHVDTQLGADSIIFRCEECGLEYRAEYRFVNVFFSEEDTVPLEQVISDEYMVLGNKAVERHLHMDESPYPPGE